jgi:hypothetical protein
VARYEGMEEMLQRVRERLGQPEAAAPEESSSPAVLDFDIPYQEQQYFRALDQARALLSSAEQLRDLLRPEYLGTLAPDQHEQILRIVNEIALELKGVEEAVQRRAPFE